jgi:hypothetical protein
VRKRVDIFKSDKSYAFNYQDIERRRIDPIPEN